MAFLSVISDLESNLISVERCSNFEKIKPEEQYTNIKEESKQMCSLPLSTKKLRTNDYAPDLQIANPQIIKEGKIEFRNVCARYPMKSRDVLHKLNFTVNPGEKIGVVGRTAAGKTSLIKLFWRCLDYYNGEILIDGKDIKKCSLKTLRTEMDVVSQDAVIFEGTLRENLNPQTKDKSEDEMLLEVLETLQFKSGQKIDLDMQIDSSGSKLSVGEKQIISFSRILLSKRKLVI